LEIETVGNLGNFLLLGIISWKFPGKLPGNNRKFPGKLPGNNRKYVQEN
jgi:hypothetical protein